MRPTSTDLRKRIVAARLEDSQSMGQIADRFRIPKATVQSILKHHRDAGTVEPKPQNAGRKRSVSGAALRKLEREVGCQPDATLERLRERLRERCGLNVSVVTVHNTLKRMGFRLKKRRYVRANSAAKM